MTNPSHNLNPQTGVTVYPLIEAQEEATPPPLRGIVYAAAEQEEGVQPWWTAVIALATSLLMLGIGWLLVGYWNMLT